VTVRIPIIYVDDAMLSFFLAVLAIFAAIWIFKLVYSIVVGG
jgi:hypothetical protein